MFLSPSVWVIFFLCSISTGIIVVSANNLLHQFVWKRRVQNHLMKWFFCASHLRFWQYWHMKQELKSPLKLPGGISWQISLSSSKPTRAPWMFVRTWRLICLIDNDEDILELQRLEGGLEFNDSRWYSFYSTTRPNSYLNNIVNLGHLATSDRSSVSGIKSWSILFAS